MKEQNPLTTLLLAALIAVAASYATLTMTGRGTDKATTAPQRESAYDRVMRTGVLRCAYTSVNPHIYHNPATGTINGPVADIANTMAEQLELTIDWVAEVGHGEFAEGFRTGRYDAYCGILAISPHRARVATYTIPLFYTPYYVYGRTNEARFNTLADINTAAVKAAVIDGEVFQRMTHTHLPQTKEYSLPNMTPAGQLFVDVAANKADVVIHDPLIAHQYITNNPGKIHRLIPHPVEVYPVAFTVSPDEDALEDLLNAGLSSMHNFGEIESILKNHGIDATTFYRVAKPYQ